MATRPIDTPDELVSLPKMPIPVVRKWYEAQLQMIVSIAEGYKDWGLSTSEIARRAWELRRWARLTSRSALETWVVELNRARDTERYGDPEGPSFDYVVERLSSVGYSGDDLWKRVIRSASTASSEFSSIFRRARKEVAS